MKKAYLILSAVILFSVINVGLAQADTHFLAAVISSDRTPVNGAAVEVRDGLYGPLMGECDTNISGFAECTFSPNLQGSYMYLARALYPYPTYFGQTTFDTEANGNGKVTICPDDLLLPECDAIPPEYSNVNGPDSSVYSTSSNYNFNMTWTDENSANKVFIEIRNSTNVLVNNASMSNSGDNNYTYSINLPAGTWYWKSYANDTANNWASTGNQSFTISKATSTASLSLSPPSPVYGTTTVESCTDTNPEATSVLYRNGTQVTPSSLVLGAGTYDYVCNVSETQNYTSGSDSATYVVSKANSNVNLLLNSSDKDITVEAGSTANIAAVLTSGGSDIYLYQNSLPINGGASPLINITKYNSVGTYNITVIYPGDENYTSSFETHFITVQDTTPPVITILSPQNKTYPQNISYYKTNVLLNFTIDSPTSWIGYSLNNAAANKIISGPVNMIGFSKGWNNVTVYANDSYNNMGSFFTNFFYCLGDLTGPTSWMPDGRVDIRDVSFVARLFGCDSNSTSNSSKACYDARADITGPNSVPDGKIDIRDVSIVAKQFGTTC